MKLMSVTGFVELQASNGYIRQDMGPGRCRQRWVFRQGWVCCGMWYSMHALLMHYLHTRFWFIGHLYFGIQSNSTETHMRSDNS